MLEQNLTQFNIIDFESSNLAGATIKTYRIHIAQFYAFAKIKYDRELLGLDIVTVHQLLVAYVKHLKKRVEKKRLSANSIPVMLKPIAFLFNANGRENEIKWKTISVLYPKASKKTGYKPYTDEQVKKLLSLTGSPRNIALVHFLASTGARIGVLDHPLRLRHLKKMSSTDDPYFNDCYSVLFYADEDMTIEEKDIRDQSGTNAESDDEYAYYGFLTPEATIALDNYLEHRKRQGEMLTDESPIFRVDQRAKSDKQLREHGARSIFVKLDAKIQVNRTKSGNRYDIQLVHGLRKRFNTIMKKDNSINPNIAEKLMAHKRGLDGVYFKPTRQECFNEFKKAIFALTLDKSLCTFKQCNSCNALSDAKSKSCQKCNKDLDIRASDSELLEENSRLKALINRYDQKFEDYEKERKDLKVMFDALKQELQDKR